jgi:hypothetical protein
MSNLRFPPEIGEERLNFKLNVSRQSPHGSPVKHAKPLFISLCAFLTTARAEAQ